MEAYKGSGNIGAYNRQVPVYNALADSYNTQADATRALIDKYNAAVDARNAIALEERDLQQQIDSSVPGAQ